MTTPFPDHDAEPTRMQVRIRYSHLGVLAALSPAYFGMVMATGIVSLAANQLAMTTLAHGLFWLNIVLYGVLWVLTVVRAIRYPRLFFGDMFDHLQGWGFFTSVAASGILGTQFVVLARNDAVAWVLWVTAVVLWIGLTYIIFTALFIKTHKPALKRGINGGWLLAVVAAQSIAALSVLLADHLGHPYKLEMNFFALSMWLWGGMLYIWMVSLIFYRDTFFRFAPDDLVPPYWINMGAMAISSLVGALLIINAPGAPYLASLLPFIKGFTIFYWATGTWWIPLLVVLELWRHVYKHFPVQYDALYWGAVFPLGMYAASTYQMDVAMGFGFMAIVGRIFLYMALVAWVTTFLAWLVKLWRWLCVRSVGQQQK
ncbi:tellurite resistance/C4-dicarboxylate transporter family protein [Paralcaligenes sp. KSB-10]|uniref:tellurite resistance/C4-dicarboxylate transporter family protein n=1 Tax=Paralcaligenes sp. KSB-10 TaxID=2901142 RepID=UPI00351D5B70